ncbi:MAG: diacylglycerol kinase [Candidatus Bipolaricaulia bacterium]
MMRNNSLIDSIRNAIDGLIHAVRTQRTLAIQLVLASIVLGIALGLIGLERFEPWRFALLLFTIFFVLGSELLNTCLETILDLITEEHHAWVKKAKDLSAALALWAAVGSMFIGVALFWEPLGIPVAIGPILITVGVVLIVLFGLLLLLGRRLLR